ncbi:hypothetical protein E4191_00715 [Paracoccus liaowanqingii]|uniref:Uncharacterized protein n=1 Tax=Paracoccus liaowanqingii TaxID=2560053 RepID=A0A4P7HK06_9RHOB|nr:hypothetical protein [Paracoccus liaowanqingii]QBX33401.1 hypothetical protein E4191_00715 [Paracoccus liaowanqingii]
MALDYAEILARKAKRRQEDEEDDRLLAENAVAAAQELKKGLEGIAQSTGQHVLDLLNYDVRIVADWMKDQKTPLFNDDEEARFNDEIKKKYNGKTVKFQNEKDIEEQAKVSTKGRPKASLVIAWRNGKSITPVK